MRAHEFTEGLERTGEYNEELVNYLNKLGYEAKNLDSSGVISISRTSMVVVQGSGEDRAYSSTLQMIRDYLPENMHAMWFGKRTDDNYFLEISKIS